MAELIDTHAHLDYPDFESDVDAVIARAAEAGVTRIISVGTDLESSARAVALAVRHEGVFAAVGWHPGHATEAPADIRPALRELGKHPKVVALGETGLDYYRLPSKSGGDRGADLPIMDKQASLFRQHLEVAEELGLNCIVHQRDCFREAIEAVRPFAGRVRCVFHCFVGGPGDLAQVLELGGWVSFTGIVTFKTAEAARLSLAAAPVGRYMLETDCPFLAPAPFRGKRCEPAYVGITATRAAEVRNCTLEQLAWETGTAARAFFPKLG